jgi:hypothetical protein
MELGGTNATKTFPQSFCCSTDFLALFDLIILFCLWSVASHIYKSIGISKYTVVNLISSSMVFGSHTAILILIAQPQQML